MMTIMSEEERRKLWEQGRTDVDALARRADALIAETQRGGASATMSTEDFDFLYDDVRSGTEGRRLGHAFEHNPYRLAAHLRIPVRRVPASELQDSTRPSVVVVGALHRVKKRPEFAVIRLAEGQGPHEEAKTLAHELGHALNFPEIFCDRFATAFLEVPDSERPGGKWRKIQDELLARARQDAIKQVRVLAAAARSRY